VIRDGEGLVKSCTVSNCGGEGILVKGGSNVIVEECKAVCNACAGIRTLDNARVQMVAGEFAENKSSGLSAGGDSIVVSEQCKMMRNSWHWVYVMTMAQVRLVSCICQGNQRIGIITFSDSQVTAERCRLVGNGSYGAACFGHSLSLCECVLSGNKEGDIHED
jgi:hypothetical protein